MMFTAGVKALDIIKSHTVSVLSSGVGIQQHSQCLDSIASTVNDDLERIWKEAAVAYSSIYYAGMRKIRKT
jgi:hypothetical protein